MDLSAPLRSIAPGLDSAVLEVLARTESSLSSTQIARLSARGTRAGQLPVLTRLVEHGLVAAERSNTGFLYRLNRQHVLAPAVLAVTAARLDIVGRVTTGIQELEPLPVHASFFGSFARGEADEHSDLDLLLVTDNRADPHAAVWTDGLLHLSDQVLAWTGNRLETLTFTRSRLVELVAQGEPIVQSWLADSVTIHGPTVAALLRPTRRKPVRA